MSDFLYYHMDKLMFGKIYERYLAMRVFHRMDGDKILIKTDSAHAKDIMKQLEIEPIDYEEK